MRTRIVALIALLALAAIPSLPASGSPVVQPPYPWLVDADGTGARPFDGSVTTDWYYASSWSPDGSRVAFPSQAGTTIFDITTGEKIDVALGQPDWSPVDNDLLLGTASVDGAAGIYIHRLSTGFKTPVVTSELEDRPIWSPDGSQVAFINGVGEGERGHLWVVDADGSDLHQVSDIGALYIAPDWSPDGTKLAFSSWDYGLFVVGSDGSGQLRLDRGDDDRYPADPQWSPDGSQIVTSGMWLFASDRPSGSKLGKGGRYPRWSPDGSEIAYSDGSRIHVIASDGTKDRRITTGKYNEHDDRPIWSPDGTRLTFTRHEIVGEEPPGTSEVTIVYDRDVKPHSFRGSVSAGKRLCTIGRRVLVKKQRRGGSRVVGRDLTNRKGNWRVSAPRIKGRFFAVVKEESYEDDEGAGVCEAARSTTIKI